MIDTDAITALVIVPDRTVTIYHVMIIFQGYDKS